MKALIILLVLFSAILSSQTYGRVGNNNCIYEGPSIETSAHSVCIPNNMIIECKSTKMHR